MGTLQSAGNQILQAHGPFLGFGAGIALPIHGEKSQIGPAGNDGPFGAGFGGANNDAYVITSNNNSYKKEEAFQVYKAFAGVDLPIFKYFSLTSEIGAIYVEDLGWSSTAYVGASITFSD